MVVSKMLNLDLITSIDWLWLTRCIHACSFSENGNYSITLDQNLQSKVPVELLHTRGTSDLNYFVWLDLLPALCGRAPSVTDQAKQIHGVHQ